MIPNDPDGPDIAISKCESLSSDTFLYKMYGKIGVILSSLVYFSFIPTYST